MDMLTYPPKHTIIELSLSLLGIFAWVGLYGVVIAELANVMDSMISDLVLSHPNINMEGSIEISVFFCIFKYPCKNQII